jgi:hypothetical protein
MSASPCPCEERCDPGAVTNQPGLRALAYRVDDFVGFRRALLRPLGGEYALLGWRPAPGDLGLQLLEWWAYLGDVLTFYNERVANESYLRTAMQPASVTGLVGLLGYRPRPAIAAVGRVAALRRRPHPAEPLVIPDGFQLASTATPGVPVQTWEAAASSLSGLTHAKIALPPTRALLKSESSHLGSVLLGGSVAGLKPGDTLLAVSKAFPERENDWAKLTVVSASPEPDPAGGANTRVVVDAEDETDARAWMTGAAASDYRLLRSKQSAALWTQTNDAAITHDSDTQVTVLLSAAVRGIVQGDLVFLDGDNATTVGMVTDTTEIFTGVPYPGATDGAPPDIPVAHTQLTITSALARFFSRERFAYHVGGSHGAGAGVGVGGGYGSIIEELIEPAKVAVRYGLKDVGTPIGTPATSLASLPVTVTPQPGFTIATGGVEAFVEDANGAGIPVTATSNGDGTLTLAAVADTPASFSLAAPLRLLVDLVSVSRGKSVANETLGTGDATVAGQAFTLQKAPLTYLATGADFASSLKVAVDGVYWTEARTFYDRPADARVFVVSQAADGKSTVRFGDGVNGARLPSGSRVVASYRYGAGATRPPAGRLTTILEPQQNLASIHNPIAVWGGADAEQPEGVRSDAPKSVLTFGRAISGDDYETVAALAPGVTRARAYWAWDAAHQRSLVKVYVGDDAAAATSARSALAGAEDPNRPVAVVQASPIPLTVGCTLLIAPDRLPDDVAAAATAALADPDTGLFGPARMGIGRPLYTSQLEAALLVPGVLAVHGLTAAAGGAEVFAQEPVGWADPGEGSFYTLATTAITTQVDDGRGT